jgi:hypothetical protein
LSKTEKQKMLAGELYRPGSSELQADAAANKKVARSLQCGDGASRFRAPRAGFVE